MRLRPLLPLLFVVPLAAAAVDTAVDDPLAAGRQAFQAAYADANAADDGNADSEALRAYPLYPYLQAARLQKALTPAADDAIDGRVSAFLSQTRAALSVGDNAPPLRDLRRAWLLNLAERKNWPRFLDEYRNESELSLRCHAAAARIATAAPNTAPAVSPELWLLAEPAPKACDAVYDWLRASNQLTPTLIEQRTRLALRAGNAAFARSLAATLPDANAAPLLQWAALIEKPEREIGALIATPERAVETEALLDGWLRLARRDPDQALTLYPMLREARHLDAAGMSPYARALALGLAWSRRPQALTIFADVQAADLDALAAEWQLRAALWAGDWPLTARLIAALPDSLKSQARWRYWAVRAAEATHSGTDEARRETLRRLAVEDGWYAQLAAARLNRGYAPPNQSTADDAKLQSVVAALPGAVRAHELLRLGMRAPATQEWTALSDALEPAQRVQAIRVAAAWGWFDQAVATASRQMIYNDYALLYPRPFDAPVRAGAEANGLSEDLIYGLIRQESLYRADVASHANAIGLMQLLHETALRTAKRARLPAPSNAGLRDPATNIAVGSAHLRELISRFDGRTLLAIAAYNAGPRAVDRWLPETPRDADVWVENIPFNETRSYVQRVLGNALIYGWLRGGKAQPVAPWLDSIGPNDSTRGGDIAAGSSP